MTSRGDVSLCDHNRVTSLTEASVQHMTLITISRLPQGVSKQHFSIVKYLKHNKLTSFRTDTNY